MHVLSMTTYVWPFGEINLWLHLLILLFPLLYLWQVRKLEERPDRWYRADQFKRRAGPALIVSLLYALCAGFTWLQWFVYSYLDL